MNTAPTLMVCGFREFVIITVAAVLFTVGCDTADNRRQVTQHTKTLANQVKAGADSEERKAAMKDLIETLNGNWVFAQCQAAEALGSLGPLAKPALPELMKAANSKNGFVSNAAVRALSTLGPTATPAVDLLIGKVEYATTHADFSVLGTLDAVKGLGNIGEPAAKAVPILERATKLNDELVAQEAQKALDKLKRVVDTQSEQKRSPN
jgi:HEAT repeat protein